MKYTTITTLAALLLGSASAYAEEAYTKPAGFVTTEIKGATPNGGGAATPQLTVFNVSLGGSNLEGGSVSSFGSLLAAANPLPSRQDVVVSGASWTVDKWIATPHLVYIQKADLSEQAFLIVSNTGDTLRVSTGFDLSARFAATNKVRIVAASTLASIFGADGGGLETAQNPNTADSVFIWDNSGIWSQYFHNGTTWSRLSPFLADANATVIFPDEGLFVYRKVADDVKIVITGAVPVNNQISDVPSGATFVGMRFPVETELKDMGFQNLSGWVSNQNPNDADSVYYWDLANQSWVQFFHNGTSWSQLSPFVANADTVKIPGGSAVFVTRQTGTIGGSGNTHTIPYDLSPSN